MSGEVCSSHRDEQGDLENTVELPGGTARPFQDVDREHKVISSWPLV